MLSLALLLTAQALVPAAGIPHSNRGALEITLRVAPACAARINPPARQGDAASANAGAPVREDAARDSAERGIALDCTGDVRPAYAVAFDTGAHARDRVVTVSF